MPDFDKELAPTIKIAPPKQFDFTSRAPIPYSPSFTAQPAVGTDQLSIFDKLNADTRNSNPNAKGIFITNKELSENKRYRTFNPTIDDYEDFAGYGQSAVDQLANGIVKMAGTAVGTFLQGFATLPNTIAALKNGKVANLSGGPDGYEAAIDNWTKNLEDEFPNYYTQHETEHPYWAAVPFAKGSANFWGDKVIKNIGFTAGAIGSAIVQDAAVGFVTEGLGEIPLIGNQIGKASLYLNKLFSAETKLGRVLGSTGESDLSILLKQASKDGIAGEKLLDLKKLQQVGQYTKLTSGFRYGMSLYGSARTEAAVEARDGYNQVKNELVKQFKEDPLNNGEEPVGKDLQDIEDAATNAMNTRFGINMAILTVSNAIQFDNLFKSFTSASKKGFTSSITRDVEEAGKIGLKEGSLDVFEKKTTEGIPGKIWDAVKPKIANIFSEGVYEEGGQFAAERGTLDYYTRRYNQSKNKDPKKADHWDTLNEIIASTGKGLSDQFGSKDGIENMFVGALSALVTGAGMKAIDRIKGESGEKRLQASINILNQHGLTGILANQYKDTVNSLGIAADMQNAVKNKNVFKYKNFKHDMFFNFVNSRLGSDMHDVTLEQLNMLKDLPKEEFEKHFGMDFNESNKKTVAEYVDALVTKANSIKKSSDVINTTFKNPFKKSINPKTDDEKLDSIKHDKFNDWKTELLYQSSINQDTKDRLSSIQQKVSGIHALLNNDLLATLTDPKSLKELGKSYEEQATQLSATINNLTTPEERKNVKDRIKALRSLSERINIDINNKVPDINTFSKLLNFEMNNQDFTKDDVISPEYLVDLHAFGNDVNNLKERKAIAAIAYGVLSSKEGFEKYYAEPKEKTEEPTTAATEPIVPDDAAHVFVNKAGDKEIGQVGREYQIPSSKIANIDKIADDRWQVTAPNGDITFHATEAKAKEAADELNQDFADLAKVKVLALNPDGTFKVEDLAGNIQNISADKLQGYEKIESEQEKLQKFAEKIEKEQAELQLNSGTTITGNPNTEAFHQEGKLKPTPIFFISGISESEDSENALTQPTHVRNSRVFLNNVKNFSNRGNIRAILVTPNQEKALGLDGLTQLSYGTNDMSTSTDVNKGFVAQVFVEQVGNDVYFVNKEGKRLSKIGEQVDMSEVIFQTMPTTEIYYDFKDSKGNPVPRFRQNEKAQFEAHAAAWKLTRATLFAAPANEYKLYSFTVSRGIPKENVTEEKDAAGKTIRVKERNAVGNLLIPEDKIGSQEGLIVIPTAGSISHNGQVLRFPNGRPVLQYGDTLQFLNNRKFNSKEAATIYQVIKNMSQILTKDKTLDRASVEFLQNVLYYRKTNDTSGNQIYIDTDSMTLHLGKTAYDVTDIANKEQEITDQLKDTFNSINNDSLTKKFNDKFYEYYLDDSDALQEREWDNYQSYLLSQVNPDGSKRSVENIPLSTSVAQQSPSVPYSYEQKYATLEGLELPVQTVVAPVIVTPVVGTPPITTNIGNNDMGGKVVNTENIKSIGDIQFTSTYDENGNVSVTPITNTLIKEMAKDDAKLTPYIKFLEGLKDSEGNSAYSLTDTNEQILLKFITIALNDRLEKQKAAELAAAPIVTPTAPVVVQPTAPIITPAPVSTKTKLEEEQEKITPSEFKEVVRLAKFFLENPKEPSSVGDARSKYPNLYNAVFDIEKRRQEAYKGNIIEEAITYTITVRGKEYEILEEKYDKNSDKFYRYVKHSDGSFISTSKEEDKIFDTEGTNKKFIKDATSEHINLEDKARIDEDFDPELKILEGGKAAYDPNNTSDPDQEYRRVGKGTQQRMTDAEIQLFKAWAQENVPNIPWEVLENLIDTYDGEKAWGVYENGVAKFVRGGLRGTEYHEIFEGIWKGMLTDEERTALIDEFKAKDGTFLDRETGRQIEYSKATDRQIKERIADDFADFRVGKLPARSLGEKVVNFFRRILEFIKSFFSKPSLKTEMFKAIDTGKFKERTLNPTTINEAAEYRRVGNFTEEQTHEFIDDMSARASFILFGSSKKSIFDIVNFTTLDVFSQIEKQFIKEGKRQQMSDAVWFEFVGRVKENLRPLGISFDPERRGDINDESSNKNDYASETFSVDHKKQSPGAIKLTLGTLVETEPTNQETPNSLKMPKAKFSFFAKGYKLLNFSRAFATVIDKICNTNKVTKAVDKLIDLAKYDSNYVRFFHRLGGDLNNATIDFSTFEQEDWRLFVQFMQTFAKQKPDALIQYKTGDEVYTAPANLYGVIKQTQNKWVENVKALSKQKDSIIFKNRENRTYNVDREKLANVSIKTPQEQIDFLNSLGIEFPLEVYNKLKTEGKENQRRRFNDAVSAMFTYLGKDELGDIPIASITGATLGVNTQMNTLAELLVRVLNPNQDSTYFGVDGKRRQSFSDNNAPSSFENDFNECETLAELLIARPELNDVFSRGSQVLKPGGLFFNSAGVRIKSMKVKYIQGTKELDEDKGIVTSKLTIGDRFTQEINQNVNGDYYVLIPADGSTEWMMNLGNNISFLDFETGRATNKINTTFIGYLRDDIALAMDFKNRQNLKNVKDRAKELRFFKDILSPKTLIGVNNLISTNATQAEIDKFIKDNLADIQESIQTYIANTVDVTIDILQQGQQVLSTKEGWSYKGLDDKFLQRESKGRQVRLNKNKLSEQELHSIIGFANANYIINNIEYHKILFGDPFQFAIKDGQLEETKRIKSFLSPRRTTFDSVEFNNHLNDKYNKAGEIKLTPKDFGYHQHKSYTNTVTVKDVNVAGSLAALVSAYGRTNEADAMSWLMDGTYREIKQKNGQWSDEAEAFHQWQMAYTRNKLAKKGKYTYTNEALEKQDAKMIEKDAPKYTIEVLKPIVSGNKHNKNIFDQVLDKFSQMPIYYSMVEDTNLEKLYLKMKERDTGYIIMESGRKEGSEELHSLYNTDGSFNESAFNNKIQVPWKIYGIQVETTQEGEKQQTRGSQLTKIASMDLFDNGNAIGATPERQEAIREEYNRNLELLDMMHENAYNELLLKLGIEEIDGQFIMKDGKSVSETLMHEMLRREMADNAKDTIQLDENNQFRIPFEASPSYMQIRSIIYSMVDKSIVRPKMNGGAHVQVPVTMFEKATKNRGIAMKDDKGNWMKLSQSQYNSLTEEQKKDVVLTDDTLKFYTEKDPYCEIMLPFWFKEKLSKGKYKTDEDILTYLNKTDEGRSILRGIGFRIPTQSLSSAETFRVKGFLPQYMGATVVVPSEITTKAGSDFDIDKLNMYLKSIYTDKSGNIRLIKYQGSEEATKEFFSTVFDQKLEGNIVKKGELLEAVDIMTLGLDDPKGLMEKYSDMIDSLMEEYTDGSDLSGDISKQLEEFGNENMQAALKEKFVKSMYKKALENEYYDSLEKMITLPENFERLISPVNDAGLKQLAKTLDDLRDVDESTIPNRILDRNYMTSLRHAFVTAKRWVGIAAVNITNHALAQKSQVFIDQRRFALVSAFDQKFLGDGRVILPHNKVTIDGVDYPSLSGRTVKDGTELISGRLSGYATSFVDVAKDPYILKIISNDLIIGTTMLLERIGCGERGAYFLAQPIISEYITMLENHGQKGLFGKRNLEAIRAKFICTEAEYDNAEIDVSEAGLKANIKEYSEKKRFGDSRSNAVQLKVLDEFLKYAKMASYNFKFTQATNYDTTKFTSGDTLFRKQYRTRQALRTNIISSVQNILDNSHIGKQSLVIDSSMAAMGAIFKFEQDEFRGILDPILERILDANEFLSEDEYEKIANKIRTSFIDYIVQTKGAANIDIQALMVATGTSIDTQLATAKKDHPEIKILQDFEIVTSNREGGAKSIKLNANIKEAYDENLYTGMMRELRDTPSTNELFKNIVLLSILQGTYQSAISIKNIVPIEDYSAIVSPIIAPLVASEDLNHFADSAFATGNWKDENIMPTFNPMFFSTSKDEEPIDIQVNAWGDVIGEVYQYYSPLFENIEAYNIEATDRKVLVLSEKYDSDYLANNHLKVPRVVTNPWTGVRVDMRTGRTISDEDYRIMKRAGDSSLKDYYGYQKVRDVLGNPLTYTKETYKGSMTYHVYKLVNLTGDGQLLSEYYDYNKPSVVNNGTIRINEEIPDSHLVSYYAGVLDSDVISSYNKARQEKQIQQMMQQEEENKLAAAKPEIKPIEIKSAPEVVEPGLTKEKVEEQRRLEFTENGFAFEGKAQYDDEIGGTIEISGKDAIFTDDQNPTGITINDYLKENNVTKDNWEGPNVSAKLRTLAWIQFKSVDKINDIYDTKLSKLGETPTVEPVKQVEPTQSSTSVKEVTPVVEKKETPAVKTTTKLAKWHNSLSSEQKTLLYQKVGSLERIMNLYDEIPFDYSEEQYIEELKCKL